ncbi:MAG: type I-C CRISPR-associated protein Cas8c/Csd1 [Kiritimatiellae bacterium]|nr:type I-C CRISPR-associated protein Cas8c/Csd1 [Kiritimatiellia bacterium]
MLLKHLYDFAISRDLLSDSAVTTKAVRWIIDLDAEGNLLGQGPIDTATDGKRGNEFICPQTTKAKNAGGVSEFLADGLTAVFGLESNWKTVEKQKNKPKWLIGRNQNNAAKKDDFWRQMQECGKSCVQIAASLKYIEKNADIPPFLRKDGSSWKITSASGSEITLGPENFTFRVNGELLLENEKILNWWRAQHAAEVKTTKANATKGLCIITGQPDQPIAETHGVKIMGVPGGQPSGTTLVSFDKGAFVSYGFSKSLNCPTSEDAANAYCTALNHLIRSEDTSLRLGNTVFCFWAVQTKAVGNLVACLLNKPDPQTVSKFMKSPWAGIERELAKKDQFIAVMLKGCSGRVAVQHWIQKPLDQAVHNLENWFLDLDILVPPKAESKTTKKLENTKAPFNPLSIYWLANTTVREAKDLSPEVPSQLYRAALEGTAPSISLIKSILKQLRSRLVGDENYRLVYDQSRFALLKLILNRNRKESDMKIRPQLAADTDDPAYNCGRLLSVLSEAQKKAQNYPKGFTGVAERYFGTASTSPATVFPLLMRLNRHHLDKIRKSGGSDYQGKQIQDIIALFKPQAESLPPAFPRHLDLQAQGRFALGFYQQQAADAAARADARENKSTATKDDIALQPESLDLFSK